MKKGIELTIKTMVVLIVLAVTMLFIIKFLQVGFPGVVEPVSNISKIVNKSAGDIQIPTDW